MLKQSNNNDDDEYCQTQISVDSIIDTSYAYISNNAVGVQLIEKGDTNYLKVN